MPTGRAAGACARRAAHGGDLLLVRGISERVVMDLMGWSIQLMLLPYKPVIDELRRDAADRIGVALFGPLATTLAPSGRR